MSMLSKSLGLLAISVLLASCRVVGNDPDSQPSPSATDTSLPTLPVVDLPLTREGLLLAVGRAASDFALGVDDGDRQRELAGRRFEVALRFGCPGNDSEARDWTFNESTRVLRVKIRPDLTTGNPLVSGPAFAQFEAAEGFLLRRPWLFGAACPQVQAQVAPTVSDAASASPIPVPAANPSPAPKLVAPAPVIGLAHFFTAEDSRTLRRENRAYEATVKLAEGEQPSAQGYNLVLSGRLAALPDGRVIACKVESADAAPACVASAAFDHVSLQRPDGTVVADWTSG
ncbi:MAG: hypothetical protein ABIT16_12480 [Croceibacterium sp.]